MVLRDGALARVLWTASEEVLVRAWAAGAAVRFRARGAVARGVRGARIERMRFALGTDHDLGEFHRRFRCDPLIGPGDPPAALAAAAAAAGAVRGARLGGLRAADRVGPRRGDPARDRAPARAHGAPAARCARRRRPACLAGRAPAELDACGLAPKRSIALVRAAREVASRPRRPRAEHEPSWRRLRAIPNIGNWTIEMLAFAGQGRDDKLPALDLAYVKLVGLLAGLGRRATEDEVREFFAPYEEYAALAGCYALQRSYV